jgi:proteasome-associated ATPase
MRDAREQLLALREEVDRLAQPPSGYGVFLERFEDGTVDIFTGGRKLRVAVSPDVDKDNLHYGQEVMLNEAMNVVAARGFERVGEVVMLKEILEGGDRALVIGHTDEERVAYLSGELRHNPLRAGDSLLMEPRSGFVYERIPRARSRSSSSKKCRTSTTPTSAAVTRRSSRSATPSSCRSCTPTCSASTSCARRRAFCLWAARCGKTLIAKAVANSLATRSRDARKDEDERRVARASYFLNIKGPELLNKYVGETERHIRWCSSAPVRRPARAPGHRVLRRDGLGVPHPRSGVSSDVENTIVPQLLSEIDGVEGLENVIVIGASNREDMIDPAILRPGGST